MLPVTILVDDAPRCIVRPVDMKSLQRFLRNGRAYLLRHAPEGRLSHRMAVEAEADIWREARDLHLAWGGTEEDYFGVPL